MLESLESKNKEFWVINKLELVGELAIHLPKKKQRQYACSIQLFVHVDVHSKQALNVAVWCLGL